MWPRKAKIFTARELQLRQNLWMRRDRIKNPQKYKSYERRWRAQRLKYAKRRYWTDPIWNLLRRHRSRIRDALEGKGGQLDHSIQLLGCAPSHFRCYLESLFLPGMSWANRHLWHIDHKIPICKFDLTTLEGQKAAFHYSNTQPLWAVDNWRKGGRLASA